MSKCRQPSKSKLSKKTRLKRRKTTEISRTTETAAAVEGIRLTAVEDDRQQRPSIQEERHFTDGEDTEEGVRVEALSTVSEEHQNHNKMRGPPLITPNRRSRRLEEKRGKQDYEREAVASLASRRKALMADDSSGINLLNLDVLDLMSDDILLDIAHTCEVDLGREGSEQKSNLDFVRKVET